MRLLVPLGGLGAVLLTAMVLVLVVTLRPWAGPDTGYDTHLNILEEPPEGYTRSELAFITAGPGELSQWTTTHQSPSAAHGQALFISAGCGSCHGSDAFGGPVGPSLRGATLPMVLGFVRAGPRGMPAYTPQQLTDDQVREIAGFIASLGPKPSPPPGAATASATPWPTPTPTPAPTPLPGESAPPQPTPTPTPAGPSPADIEAGARVFNARGCSACHGAQAAGGLGPNLRGLGQEAIATAVRQGRGIMAPYPESALSDAELAQVVAFIMSLKP